jgi:hypothetical protein
MFSESGSMLAARTPHRHSVHAQYRRKQTSRTGLGAIRQQSRFLKDTKSTRAIHRWDNREEHLSLFATAQKAGSVWNDKRRGIERKRLRGILVSTRRICKTIRVLLLIRKFATPEWQGNYLKTYAIDLNSSHTPEEGATAHVSQIGLWASSS